MQVYHSLKEFPRQKEAALTLGNFDGVHRGHQWLLYRLKKLHLPTIVVTFANHPMTIFHPQKKYLTLITLPHKLRMLEKMGIDFVLLLPFTKEMSQKPYDLFLKELKKYTGFTHLVLGKQSSFGKNREGVQQKVCTLQDEIGFRAHYIEKKRSQNRFLSTSQIKQKVLTGDIAAIEIALGATYTIYLENPKQLDLLLLPPDGRYRVSTLDKELEITIAQGKISPSMEYPIDMQFHSSSG